MTENEKVINLVSEKLNQELKNREKELSALESLIKEEQQKRKILLEFSKLRNAKKTSDVDGLYCLLCNRSTFQGEDGFRLHYQFLHPSVPVPNLKPKLKKKIIVGNTSRYVPEKLREPDDNTTHFWILYIRGPPDDTDLSYIRSIRLQIHESYAPNDVIDMPNTENRPFFLKRRAYAEFPIYIEIFFHNPELNKSLKITHQLSLDKTNCGRELIGPETHVEIEFKLKPIELPTRKFEIKTPTTPTDTNGETPIRKRVKREKGTKPLSDFCQICGQVHRETEEFCRNSKITMKRPTMEELTKKKEVVSEKVITMKNVAIDKCSNLLSDEISVVKRAIRPFDIQFDSAQESLSNIILAKALSAFMNHLVSQSVEISQSDNKETIVAPLHVYKAGLKNPEFAFLNNPNQ